MVTTLAAMGKLKINPYNASCAVQGFGNVGMWAARLLEERGLKIVAISDLSGAYYNENGMDIDKAVKYRDGNNGTLDGYAEAQKINGTGHLNPAGGCISTSRHRRM